MIKKVKKREGKISWYIQGNKNLLDSDKRECKVLAIHGENHVPVIEGFDAYGCPTFLETFDLVYAKHEDTCENSRPQKDFHSSEDLLLQKRTKYRKQEPKKFLWHNRSIKLEISMMTFNKTVIRIDDQKPRVRSIFECLWRMFWSENFLTLFIDTSFLPQGQNRNEWLTYMPFS